MSSGLEKNAEKVMQSKGHRAKLKQNFERKIAIIFLSIYLNMGFECSKEPSHRDDSFEYPQHMFWLRNKKKKFSYALLIWGAETENAELRSDSHQCCPFSK